LNDSIIRIWVEAMPSRKKAKGQARKAAQAKNEEAERARQLEERYRRIEQSQIQRLQVRNQYSVLPLCSCLHGFDPFPHDDICIKFIRAFVYELYNCMREQPHHSQVERVVIGCLLHAKESTKDEYSEVWNSADKMKQVVKYFLYNGTMHILADTDGYAHHSAMLGRFFEQWLKARVHNSQACIDWPRVIECGLVQSDEHTLVKYFWRRIRCSCLDKKYEEVKSITKKGVCFNQLCTHPERTVERSELRCCSRCRIITYCCRECQAADWLKHKDICDHEVATRAEFDARQQQQS
jgi:hypothetical protein